MPTAVHYTTDKPGSSFEVTWRHTAQHLQAVHTSTQLPLQRISISSCWQHHTSSCACSSSALVLTQHSTHMDGATGMRRSMLQHMGHSSLSDKPTTARDSDRAMLRPHPLQGQTALHACNHGMHTQAIKP